MTKKYIFVLLLLLVITGCGSSALLLKSDTITLSIDQVDKYLKTQPHKTINHNFQTLYISQHILRQDEGKYIVFEETRTDPNYQYEPGTQKSIEIIFETDKIIKVYGKNFLNFYQLVLKDGRMLNLIAQQNDDQELTLLYGMDTHTFNRIITHFDAQAKKANHYNVLQITEDSNAIQTKWNVRKIHFEPLIVPLMLLMGPSG